MAAAGLIACATMDGITKRTADSPQHPWVPSTKDARPPEPLSPPSIPAELLTAGRAWTLADIVDVGLSNDPGHARPGTRPEPRRQPLACPWRLSSSLQRRCRPHQQSSTRAAWNAARAASAAVSISLGAYLPSIGATLTGTKQKAVFAGGQFIIDQTTLTPAASLNLLIFDFGGREADVRSARLALEAANWTQNAVLQNVILGIEGVYYQYLAARALLEAQETSRKGAQANYDAANDRHRAGVATIADVLQAKTALSTIDLQLVTTRGLIQTLHGALASSMGLPAAAPFEVAEGLPEDIPFESVTKQVELSIKEAVAKRPDLAAARAQVLEAEAAVRKARSTFFPALSLSGNAGRIYYRGNPVRTPSTRFRPRSICRSFSGSNNTLSWRPRPRPKGPATG